MSDKNEQINAYLSQNVKSFDDGLRLLEEFGPVNLAARLRRGNPKAMMPRLISLLRNLAWQPGTTTHSSQLTVHSSQTTDHSSQPQQPNSPSTEPVPISRAKDKLHEVYLQIVDFHKQLIALGDDNSEHTKAARVAIISRRKPYLDAFYQLWDLKEDYFAHPEGKRVIPPQLIQLLDILDGKASQDPPRQISAINDQFSTLSDLEIIKKRHAVRQAITRRQNQLRFQQNTPAPSLDPMPTSPKRCKIESEISTLQQQLEILDNIIKSRGI